MGEMKFLINLNKPLVSICIPTYNRAEYLIKSINSIIKEKEFITGEVEIVISDNASTDRTRELVSKYTDRFINILYFRNHQNIGDKNFVMAIARGTGILRKLSNDTIIYNNGGLKYLCDKTIKYCNTKPILFFSNKGNFVDYNGRGIEDFLWHVSYDITWIGAFCLWDSNCDEITSQLSFCSTHLWQVWNLCQNIDKDHEFVIISGHFEEIQTVRNKDISYGLYKIFYQNHFEILDLFVKRGLISSSCIKWLKKDLLFRFFTFWIVRWETQNGDYKYSINENLKAMVFNQYKNENYFPYYLLYYRLYKIKYKIKAYISNKF